MPTNYTVSQGECISSLAAANGFAPETLWNHAENAQLKASRKDPNVLYSGDSVCIPDKQPKTVSKSTDGRHVFKRKGVPTKIRIRLTDDGRPRADVPYQL
jgi:N-acetylmuramoyl-L-alanine amidase